MSFLRCVNFVYIKTLFYVIASKTFQPARKFDEKSANDNETYKMKRQFYVRLQNLIHEKDFYCELLRNRISQEIHFSSNVKMA